MVCAVPGFSFTCTYVSGSLFTWEDNARSYTAHAYNIEVRVAADTGINRGKVLFMLDM